MTGRNSRRIASRRMATSIPLHLAMLPSSLRFAPPPRRVPFSLGITTALNAVAQIGFGVLGFSSIFFWTFVGNADFSFVTFVGKLGRVTGTITRVEYTNARENRQTIRANHY